MRQPNAAAFYWARRFGTPRAAIDCVSQRESRPSNSHDPNCPLEYYQRTRAGWILLGACSLGINAGLQLLSHSYEQEQVPGQDLPCNGNNPAQETAQISDKKPYALKKLLFRTISSRCSSDPRYRRAWKAPLTVNPAKTGSVKNGSERNFVALRWMQTMVQSSRGIMSPRHHGRLVTKGRAIGLLRKARVWARVCIKARRGRIQHHHGKAGALGATLTNAAQIQELIGALKGAYSNTSTPPEIAEMLARAEGGASKQQTKYLHSCTTQLGAARKQLHAARAAIQTQEATWAAFLQQTADAVEKGAADHSSRMEEYKAKEEEVLQRITAARKQIRALAAAKNEAEEVDASEPELMEMEGCTTESTAESTAASAQNA